MEGRSICLHIKYLQLSGIAVMVDITHPGVSRNTELTALRIASTMVWAQHSGCMRCLSCRLVRVVKRNRGLFEAANAGENLHRKFQQQLDPEPLRTLFRVAAVFHWRMDDERPHYECPTSGIAHCPAASGVEEAHARHSVSGGRATRRKSPPRCAWPAQIGLSPELRLRLCLRFNPI